MTSTARSERIESALLVLILAVVAIAAGWASFTHVHDWTMRHVPAGTPSAFGWVNAVISELVPVAAFLTIRRRQRIGASIGYPVVLLLASAALSLAAQLAVASPSPSGWLLSAVPALAFMALVKLVFATPADSTPGVDEPTPLPVDTEPPVEPEPPAPRARTTAAVVPVPAGAFTRLQTSEVNHR
ncbi:hypothetical protein GCM10020358_03880 [Amorphoplanes nipponensis]|uniref:DUF2637 domain-containing protein n=1 Tax=Actinoplanes nipponensis TaxID=135950 RepID=A0A919JNY0_9ACTN|nr:DUF2637 domain-containing protein [Actinoplanes nipponensis]GIE52665.1 hypothetical protein Ani05nite_61990 [Actinoplanes nipponensis]